MSWSSYSYSMIDNIHIFQSLFKHCFTCFIFHKQCSCPFRSIISLNFSYREWKGFYQLHKKIFGAVSAVFVIHFSEAESCTFVYRCVLIEFFSAWYAIAWHIFYIYLYFLSRICCSFIWLGFAWFSLFYFGLYIFLYYSKHACVWPCITAFSNAIPQHYHIVLVSWITA